MSWFRTKKNTCPYCRHTGTQVHESDRHQAPRNESEVRQHDWETNEHVQIFLTAGESVTKEQIIEAYYIRDINMDISINTLFENLTRMFSVDPGDYEKQIKCSYKKKYEAILKHALDNSISNQSRTYDINASLNFNEYVITELESDKYKTKLKMYQEMEQFKENNDYKGLYNMFSIDDLMSLGW
jgi:hypothetical protein